jgi:hypothetical protein
MIKKSPTSCSQVCWASTSIPGVSPKRRCNWLALLANLAGRLSAENLLKFCRNTNKTYRIKPTIPNLYMARKRHHYIVGMVGRKCFALGKSFALSKEIGEHHHSHSGTPAHGLSTEKNSPYRLRGVYSNCGRKHKP